MPARAQIVNIENSRLHSDTTGWMGSLGGNFILTKQVDMVLQLNARAHVQYKNLKNLYLVLGNYSVVRGADESLIDNGFFHFRYNRKLGDVVRWEAFTQIQNNIVTKIKSRWLAGMGPRFKISDKPKLKIYAAATVMYEVEREDLPIIVQHNDFRNSNYISFTWIPSERVRVISTTFYQPLLKDFSDYRISTEDQLMVNITEKLALTVTWNSLFDTDPAGDAPRSNYHFATGINYAF